MRLFLFAAALSAAAPALAQPAPPPVPAPNPVVVSAPAGSARWSAGTQAPGGWAGYHRPANGFILPGYWMQPRFYIADWVYYGLPSPTAGFGWSRYYDDVVLTDRYGKVYDSRPAYDWARYGDFDGPHGYGEMRHPMAPGYGFDDHRDAGLSKHEQKLAREAARQRRKLDKMARKAGFASYDAYLRAHDRRAEVGPMSGPHWAVRGGPEGSEAHGRAYVAGQANVTSYTEPGYVRGGWYYPGATVTTVTLPATTVTRTYVSTVVTRKATGRKIIKRKVVRARCRCG